MSVGYGKLFFGPDFGHFPGFLDVFWLIFEAKMVDFEFGPECRPELFEVYLGVLPGSILGPSCALPGPPAPPGPWAPGPPRDLGGFAPPSVGGVVAPVERITVADTRRIKRVLVTLK